jgi:EmrB/QacA subfamily drug resistance transporter
MVTAEARQSHLPRGQAPGSTECAAATRGADVATRTLIAALLGFFVITLDAVVVNIALPSIRSDLNAGMSGLQWVANGYTLMFAALLLSAGALSDRIGARRAFALGLGVYVAGSVASGLAPALGSLIATRFVQGAGAALIMPSTMALIGEAFPDPAKRTRAIAYWAVGGAIASSSGPVLGGVLSLASWRLNFFISVPACLLAMLLLRRAAHSPRRNAPLDWIGQATAILAMGGLTFGAIEGGEAGFGAPHVVLAVAVTAIALVAFISSQVRGAHPMVPLNLFRSRALSISVAVGFAFMVAYFGLPFVMSLYLQQERGLSSLDAGTAFLPMMVIGAVLTPFSARFVEWWGPRAPIVAGLLLMTTGLTILAFAPYSTPVWMLAGLMTLVGLAGPLVSPPTTAVMLNSVPRHQTGTASGVYNTSRQIGGALAVAVFGALLANQTGFMDGMRVSLLIAAGVALAAALAGLFLGPRPANGP